MMGLLAAVAPVRSEPVRDAHAEVELVAHTRAVRPGGELRVEIRFRIDPGWHLYGQDPGEAGMPTRVDWRLLEGVTTGALQWPQPKEFREGPIVTRGYEREVVLAAPLRVAPSIRPGRPLILRASVRWLSCREECIPGKAELTLSLPVERGDAL